MGFAYQRSFRVIALLGNANSKPLWDWPIWQRAVAKIDPIVWHARGKPGVRCNQYEGRRTVRFGKISWNEVGHHKWSHGSPLNLQESQRWQFSSLELWCPIWTACERDGSPPDFYLSVCNEGLSAGYRRSLAFNPTVVLAFSQDVRELSVLAQAMVVELAQLMNAQLMAEAIRPWGISSGGGGFTKAIQDLSPMGLFKPGQRHDRPVSLDTFADDWQQLVI